MEGGMERWIDLNRILMLNVYNCYFVFLHAKMGVWWNEETLSGKGWTPLLFLSSDWLVSPFRAYRWDSGCVCWAAANCLIRTGVAPFGARCWGES